MKKLLSLFLAVAIMLCAVPLGAFSFTAKAATEYTDGYYTYTVENKEATITDVSTEISGSIIIPSTLGDYKVTSIGYGAFYDCTGLTSITILDSITSIDDWAFRGCTGLTSITILESVISIGKGAVYGCDGLVNITLPFIGGSATENQFLGYIFGAHSGYENDDYVPSSLKTVIISDKCASIGEYAFYDCTDLTSIIIPKSVTSIASYAFYDCTGLTSITISDSVTSIGGSAFSGCTGLTSITIPDSVASIGGGAFCNCTRLRSVTIGSDVTSVGNGAFANTAYYNDENNWKDNALYIGNYLIEVKTNIFGNYVIKDDTKVIGYSAFLNCDGLRSITIPDSVTSIGNYAFNGCTGLTSVTIGNGVTSIGYEAFKNCTSLTSVTIGNGVTSIGNYAFNGCTSLTSVTIPDGVTSIGEYTFDGCTGLTSVTIGNGVTSIGYEVFKNCTGLTSVTIGNGVTSIGNYAFYHCDSLTNITIPDSVTRIGEGAFCYCYGLTSVIMGNGVTSIGDSAFYDCTGLTSITIPDSVTSIAPCAFDDCTGLKDVWYTGTQSKKAEITIGYGNSDLTDATWHYDVCPNAENKEHIFDNILDTSCNVCGKTRDVTPLEWSISVNATGVYALKPNNKYTGSFSAQKITVLDENGGVVKYNDTKGGFPLVKDLKYTVKFNYDCIKDISGTITWSKTQKAKTIFPDTYAGDWYNDSVTYVVGAGIMSGYQNGKFGTSDSIQRQDFLVMLARYEGVDLDEYSYKSGFSDVARNSYYEAAVNWGVEKGITTGYDNGKFGVGDKMTREQLVTFLYRYAKYKGVDVSYTTI